MKKVRTHVERQRCAIRGSDIGQRSFVPGDFHVCLGDCLSNKVTAGMLRDPTARAALIAVLYQSEQNAAQSCAEHLENVEALAKLRQAPHTSNASRSGKTRNSVRLSPSGELS